MTPRSINLHIEELVLEGLVDVDPEIVRSAIEQHMTLLLAQGGAPGPLTSQGQTAHLKDGSIDITPGAGAEAIGNQAAQTLYKGLSQ